MKHTLSIIIALLFAPIIAVQADDLSRSISIVPTPVQMVPGEGSYRFSDQTVFAVENSGQAEVVRNFIKLFTRAAGFTPQLKEGSASGGDVCCVTDRNLKSEAYRLEVTPNRIVMKASDTKGFFYALQTIRLLLPSSIENARNVGGNPDWTVPSVKISDEPRSAVRLHKQSSLSCLPAYKIHRQESLLPTSDSFANEKRTSDSRRGFAGIFYEADV